MLSGGSYQKLPQILTCARELLSSKPGALACRGRQVLRTRSSQAAHVDSCACYGHITVGWYGASGQTVRLRGAQFCRQLSLAVSAHDLQATPALHWPRPDTAAMLTELCLQEVHMHL